MTATARDTTIVIVDNHAILREGLSLLLEAQPGFRVIAAFDNGMDAVHGVVEHNPDIILMDISMPHTGGIEAIVEIRRRAPDVRILVLTVHDTEEYVRAALNAGADGYALKDDGHTELMLGIHKVLEGKTYLSAHVSGDVVSGFLGHGGESGRRSSLDSLTHRERQVMKLIAEGNPSKEIARYLSLSPKTVEKHRSNLMRKLNLHNVASVTAYAIERGLVDR